MPDYSDSDDLKIWGDAAAAAIDPQEAKNDAIDPLYPRRIADTADSILDIFQLRQALSLLAYGDITLGGTYPNFVYAVQDSSPYHLAGGKLLFEKIAGVDRFIYTNADAGGSMLLYNLDNARWELWQGTGDLSTLSSGDVLPGAASDLIASEEIGLNQGGSENAKGPSADVLLDLTGTLAYESPTGAQGGTVLDNRIIVKSASDFVAPISGTKEYFIDGIIDMTGVSLEIPAGGILITGYDLTRSRLVNAEDNYTMFTSPLGGSGFVIINKIDIEVSGATNSKVFALESIASPINTIVMNTCRFFNCTDLGYLDGFAVGLETTVPRVGGTPSLELRGTWAQYQTASAGLFGVNPAMTEPLFKAGAGFLIADRFLIDNMTVDLTAAMSFIDFAPANFLNPSSLIIRDLILTRATVLDAEDANLTPNIEAIDLQSDWKDNKGLKNTFVGASMRVTVEIDTTNPGVGVFADLDGTWTPADLQHFSNPTNGHLHHLGINPREFSINAAITIDGPSGDLATVKIVKFDFSTSSFIDVAAQTKEIQSLPGPDDNVLFVVFVNVTLDQNDYIKVQVANLSTIADLRAHIETYLGITAR